MIKPFFAYFRALVLFLTKRIKLNNITFNLFNNCLIKVALTVTVFSVTYFTFNVLFVTAFCNFKGYNIKPFIIKKRMR